MSRLVYLDSKAYFCYHNRRLGGVAQLVRASACHAEGHRFEPGRPRH